MLSSSICPQKQELREVDKPGPTSTAQEDLPGQFSVDNIKSHRQALKGQEQVAVMFSALSPAVVKVVKSDTGGFVVFEWSSNATGRCP